MCTIKYIRTYVLYLWGFLDSSGRIWLWQVIFDSIEGTIFDAVGTAAFPAWVDDGLDSHKAFVVRYAMGEDLDLAYHFDNAEVTLNVSLGKQFTGGNLYFGKMKNVRNNKFIHTSIWQLNNILFVYSGNVCCFLKFVGKFLQWSL